MSKELTPQQPSTIVAVPFEQQRVLAAAIAASGLFGMKTPEQALVLMALCESEGLHPIRAAQDYHIINGRPSMRAEAMMSRFQAAGGVIRWLENTDARCSAVFSHPSSPDPVTIDWDLERAKKAELLKPQAFGPNAGKTSMWEKYPRAMLRARVISEGIRTVYPGVLSGMYTPEEVRDIAPDIAPIEGEIVAEVPPYDFDAATAVILACKSKDTMRRWLKEEAKRMGWKPGDHDYESVKELCAEHAKALDKASAIPPLNSAPGKPATKESLAAAGFDGSNPEPFDDPLDAVFPAEEEAVA